MNSASHTTAKVVQSDARPPRPTHPVEVSSHTTWFTARIKALFSSFLSRRLPQGYEDEAGFHYGALPKDYHSY